MTSSLRRQEGMGFLGIIAVLAVVGFIGLLGVRMVPIYLEANTVRGIVQGMQDDPAMRGASHREIRQRLARQFQVNNVSGPDLDEDLVFERMAGGTSVQLRYEVRFPVIANLDGVAAFETSAVVPGD
ncbi:DUF4845 domain-containing protein [Alkalilimnicola ehrlichii MLHE-1]|uniref:DUF4845 domain-containing protein n=1 Tax=Alkalilimnicola ehrlichii (strain ATCC BAA-1101 / DSM 17681 / MLHE-1) TaxID=187272 RepID=Q0A8Z2_ALKEH|nr:DUF4845 domain-containing protein [Alkalilimnicola ehrlichii]ABI56695.1 conserved hypothetical protein [Alkalilimnicola ehrlichii MLHE-1]